MKILFLNYMSSSLATMIRSLELARAASLQRHKVEICFMNPAFNPPLFFFDVIKSYQTENLSILYTRRPPSAASHGVRSAGKITECKPSQAGLIKQVLGSFRYIFKELRLFKDSKPDVIVARPDHVLSFVFSSRIFGIPLVLETDGPVEELDYYWGISSKWLIYLDTLRAKNTKAILYISDLCGKLWEKKRIPQEMLFLCPNGADPQVFKPLDSKQRQASLKKTGLDESIVIGFSGNQRSWHGVKDLLKSALPLLLENRRLKILIIGMIEDRASLELDEIPEEVSAKQIVFTGSVNYLEMPSYIDLADIIVMPYPRLDFFHFSPMKMFEAMSLGKIIVASGQGQIQAFLKNAESAFLYDPSKPGDLSDALRRAIEAFKSGKNGMKIRDLLIREHSWMERGKVVVKACEYALSK